MAGYWSGYEPGKQNPDGTWTPLSPRELQEGAARFRRDAQQALFRGETLQAKRFEEAADDWERRASA